MTIGVSRPPFEAAFRRSHTVSRSRDEDQSLSILCGSAKLLCLHRRPCDELSLSAERPLLHVRVSRLRRLVDRQERVRSRCGGPRRGNAGKERVGRPAQTAHAARTGRDGAGIELDLDEAAVSGVVREALEGAGVEVESAELTMLPRTTVQIEDESAARKLLRLMDALDENDDVQDVYANFDIPERMLEAVAS